MCLILFRCVPFCCSIPLLRQRKEVGNNRTRRKQLNPALLRPFGYGSFRHNNEERGRAHACPATSPPPRNRQLECTVEIAYANAAALSLRPMLAISGWVAYGSMLPYVTLFWIFRGNSDRALFLLPQSAVTNMAAPLLDCFRTHSSWSLHYSCW